LICVNGRGCHYWFGLAAGTSSSPAPKPAGCPRRFSPVATGAFVFTNPRVAQMMPVTRQGQRHRLSSLLRALNDLPGPPY